MAARLRVLGAVLTAWLTLWLPALAVQDVHPDYDLTLIPVGKDPGGLRNIFNVIDDKGRVAGFTADWHKSPKGTSGYTVAIFENHKFTPLPTLGGADTVVYAANGRGDLTGTSDVAAGGSHAFLYRRGHMRDLGTVGGMSSNGLAINADDMVVGESDAADGTRHAFVWRDGRISDFNDLVAPDANLFGGESYVLASATAIDDAGTVLLFARRSSGALSLVRLALNHLTEIVPPKSWGPILSAGSLKSDGSFSGSFKNAAGTEEGFVYSHGAFHEIGTLSGASRLYGMNGQGLAVGESQAPDGSSHAILWDGHGLVDLNALFDEGARNPDGTTYRLAAATGIDSAGRITGAAWQDSTNPYDAVFILTPSRGPGLWFWIALACLLVVAALIFAFARAHPARFAELSSGALGLARTSVVAVTQANALSLVSTLGTWLVGIAVFQALAFTALMVLGFAPITVFTDPLVYGFAGVFLIWRRSRAVAIFVTLYALSALVFGILFAHGTVRAFITIAAAAAALHASWQAVRASWLAHGGSATRWTNVALVTGAASVAFVMLLVALTFAANKAGMDARSGYAFDAVSLVALAIAVFAVMTPLTARLPFARKKSA